MLEIITVKEIDEINNDEIKLSWSNLETDIKTIFYEASSLKSFSSEERKKAFFKRWCGDYLTYFREDFLIMADKNLINSKRRILGYLSGCPDSLEAQKVLEVPGYGVFSGLFETFPAHFHVNFSLDSRGKGLGTQLVNAYKERLHTVSCRGVHLVTGAEALNINFYKRLGFNIIEKRVFNQMELLFMGSKVERSVI